MNLRMWRKLIRTRIRFEFQCSKFESKASICPLNGSRHDRNPRVGHVGHQAQVSPQMLAIGPNRNAPRCDCKPRIQMKVNSALTSISVSVTTFRLVAKCPLSIAVFRMHKYAYALRQKPTTPTLTSHGDSRCLFSVDATCNLQHLDKRL